MKRLILLFGLLATATLNTGWSYGLVDNSATRDTLSIPFVALDSAGRAIDLADGDSLYVAVFYPGGATAFKDSMAYNDAKIKSCVWEDFDGGKSYAYTERISVLDGGNPVNGVYSYILTVDDNSGADLITTHTGYFQVVNAPFERSLDSASYAQKAIDSLNVVLDSLAKIIDSLESLDDWVGNVRYAHSDSTLRLKGFTIDGIEDSNLIARWVWNTPQANHTLIGTYGKYLDTEVSGIAGGSGLYSYGLIITDSSTGQVVPGVNIAVRNIEQTALVALGTTDNLGFTGFNLDADSFLVTSFSPGYIFDDFDTLVVIGPGADTVYGCRFDPGEPSNPDLCRLYGFIYDINGNPDPEATVTAHLPSGVTRAGGTLVSPFKVETGSDSTGYFYIDLFPNSRLTPDTTRYEITIMRVDGTILREKVAVPDQPNWQFTW